jgi:fatty acid hydroxylase domain-containing protein 2
MHHEWQSPIGIVSSYAHPLEYIISDVIPVIMGIVFIPTHPVSMYFWFTYAMFHTVNIHSGYHLPFLQSPEAHDYHHLKFNQNYGIMGVMDHIHDTDTQWLKTKSGQRHMPLYSTRPIRDYIPDAKGE